MKSNPLIVSGLVRVRNNGDDLQRCLEGFRQQVLPENASLELVVVDNESTDHSVEVARQFGAKVVPISTSQFSWGRALNVGIQEATGTLVAILSSDAYPANPYWLAEMVRPFEDPQVAAVYGRQIPRSDAPVDEQVRLQNHFKETSVEVDHVPDNFSADGGGLSVSNACAAIRRNLWEKLPYDERMAGGEEGVWTYEHLKQRYKVVYQASACVYHSHKDSILRFAWRIWELLKKSTQLNRQKMHSGTILYAGLSLAKRRILNCCRPSVTFGSRIVGLLRLPFEITALYSIAIVDRKKSGDPAIRSFFWDSKI